MAGLRGGIGIGAQAGSGCLFPAQGPANGQQDKPYVRKSKGPTFKPTRCAAVQNRCHPAVTCDSPQQDHRYRASVSLFPFLQTNGAAPRLPAVPTNEKSRQDPAERAGQHGKTVPAALRRAPKAGRRGFPGTEAYRHRCGAQTSNLVDGRKVAGRFDSYTLPPFSAAAKCGARLSGLAGKADERFLQRWQKNACQAARACLKQAFPTGD